MTWKQPNPNLTNSSAYLEPRLTAVETTANNNSASLAEKSQQSDIGVSVESFKIQTPETDDTARIQRAINTLTNGGLLIFEPNKNYTINGSITNLDNIIFVGNYATIQGNGSNTVFNAGNNNRFINFNFKSVSCAIKGMNTSKLYVERCTFDTIATVAVYFYGVNDGSVSFSNFNNITQSSVIVDNQGYNIEIVGNHMTNPSLYGGYSAAQTTAHVNILSGADVRVIGNRVKNNGGQGICFSVNSTLGNGATYCRAIGNYLEGNGQEGITCFGGTNKLSYGHIVQGNTCRNNRYHQLEVWQADKCTLDGNLVEENSTTGNIGAITMYQTNLSKAVGNTILNAQNNGIAVIAGSDKCVVSDNIIRETNLGNFSQAQQGNGVILDSNGITQPTNITITHNVFESTNANVSTKSGVYSTSNTQKGNVIDNTNRGFGYKSNVHFFAMLTCFDKVSSAPTSGQWLITDIAKNNAPASAGYVGWVCVTSGTANGTAWVATTAYTVGQQINANSKVYQCTVAGTSGSTAPSHTTGTATDGTVTWQYVDTLAVFKTYGVIS